MSARGAEESPPRQRAIGVRSPQRKRAESTEFIGLHLKDLTARQPRRTTALPGVITSPTAFLTNNSTVTSLRLGSTAVT